MDPHDELNQLDADEQELLTQLAAKRKQKEEVINAQRLAAIKLQNEQPVVVRITALKGNYVYFENAPYRDDILPIFQNIEGRIWRPTERANAVPLGSYEVALKQLETLPRITIEYAGDVKKSIHDALYAPDFECDLDKRHFVVRTSRKASTYELSQIPGHDFNYTSNYHTIPLTEGFRLFEFSKLQTNFVWTDSAKEFVLSQVEKRLRLDEIAKAEDVELEIPNLHAKLKNFQKIGIKFFEINGGRGILGDEMGTGKTLQMIGLMLHMKWRGLVVCPAPLKENWLRELRKFAPHLTTYTCQGSSPAAWDIAQILGNKPDVIIINYDILGRSVEHKTIIWKNDKNEVVEAPSGVTLPPFGYRQIHSSTTRYPWVEVLNLAAPDLCIMDEGHYIKNTDSNRSQAARQLKMPRSIALTGTPILNRPGELWPLLHVADSVSFPFYETFKNQYTYDGKVVKNVDQLKQVLRPLMIRRLKKDVIKELEPINRINHYYDLSERGKKLYERVLAGIFEILAAWNPNAAGETSNVTNMLVKIQRLKQVVAYDGVEGTADLATEILDNSPETGDKNKVLIFSQFKATTYAISKRLGNEALSFVGLTSGREFVTCQSQEQQRLIDRFQSDPSINFLCVTEKTAKEGHNITAAKAVIFNDLFWTPAGHQQAEARAYGRISDLHTIDSYYRIGTGTISEKIMDLLAAKLQIIEQVIEGVESSRADVSIVGELISSLKEEMWSIKKK